MKSIINKQRVINNKRHASLRAQNISNASADRGHLLLIGDYLLSKGRALA